MASDRSQRRIERLLDEADDAVAHLDWETVRVRAQDVLAFDPQNDDAAERLAAANRASGPPGCARSGFTPCNYTARPWARIHMNGPAEIHARVNTKIPKRSFDGE